MSVSIFKTRRSIKSYKPEQITDEKLDAILEAGTYAPTGRNKQSPIMVAVQNKELLKKISAANAAVLGMNSDPFYGAPTVVIVFADSECHTGTPRTRSVWAAAGSTEPVRSLTRILVRSLCESGACPIVITA